jgi:prepilin signal peptidase PulO-like enzyme (type II secretory pathway)
LSGSAAILPVGVSILAVAGSTYLLSWSMARDGAEGLLAAFGALAAGLTLWAGLVLLEFEILAATCLAIAGLAGLGASRSDLARGTIPDMASLLIGFSGLVFGLASPLGAKWGLIDAALGVVLAAGVLWLAGRFVKMRRGQAGLGGGDLPFAAACATWTGLSATGPALLLAVVLTAAYGLSGRGRTARGIAFAPGLFGGFLVMTVAGLIR